MLGTTLAHYRIKEKLGSGGMGEVYRAEDTRLGRDVALKVLPPAVTGDPGRRERFRREATLLASLDHPGIVTVHSVEEAAGVHFLTMQLVDGSTLDRLIPEGGLPLTEFFDIAVPLSDAVATAHERGIVHRDLKPANVMRTASGRVKVLDFGLAKLVDAAALTVDETAASTRLTREGSLVGTLPYMSPEQVRGEDIDAPSDVFALGVVFYEMAAGQRPFSGPTPAALLLSILEAAPGDLRPLRPSLPRELDTLILRCLEKDPARRPSSARVLHAELQRLREALNSTPSSPPAARPAPPAIAVLPFASLSQDADDEFLADGISEEILVALGHLPDLRVAARTSAFAFKGKNEDLRTIGERLGVGVVLEGSVRRSGKRLRVAAQLVDVGTGYRLWSERYDRQLDDVFAIQDDIAHGIASRLEATLAGGTDAPIVKQGTRDVDAFELYARGRSLVEQRTPDGMRRAADCFRAATERDPNYASAWAGLATALFLLQDYGHEPSERMLPGVRQASHRALALEPNLAESHATLSLLHAAERDGGAAIAALERAVGIQPSHAEAHNWLSWLHSLAGHTRRALACAERAVELNPLSPEGLSNLSLSCLEAGQPERARRTARRAVDLQPDFTSNVFLEGLALFELGRLADARAILRDIDVPWAGAGPESSLALLEVTAGNLDAAHRLRDALLERNDYANAGVIAAALGRLDEAFGCFARVERWDYWPMLAVHHLFPALLGPLRADPRHRDLVRAIDRQWNFDPGDHSNS